MILVIAAWNFYNPFEMAARTCLLCGKPLSRIWAGTGEDFCSREHRNQYRLRRGMERLSEANQVATVMRRREQTKQIPTSELRAPGPLAPRAFLKPAPPQLPEMAAPVVRPEGRPQMQPAGQFAGPRAVTGESVPAREVKAPRIAIRPLIVPGAAAVLHAHVNPAPPVGSRRPEKGDARRIPESVKWAGRVLPLSVRMAMAQQRFQLPVRTARVAPHLGRALRVSTAKAFRITASMAPALRFTPPQTNELPRLDVKVLMTILPPAGMEHRTTEIASEPQATRLPAAPPPSFERRFRWPGALETTLQFRNTANGHWTSTVPFGSPDETKERR